MKAQTPNKCYSFMIAAIGMLMLCMLNLSANQGGEENPNPCVQPVGEQPSDCHIWDPACCEWVLDKSKPGAKWEFVRWVSLPTFTETGRDLAFCGSCDAGFVIHYQITGGIAEFQAKCDDAPVGQPKQYQAVLTPSSGSVRTNCANVPNRDSSETVYANLQVTASVSETGYSETKTFTKEYTVTGNDRSGSCRGGGGGSGGGGGGGGGGGDGGDYDESVPKQNCWNTSPQQTPEPYTLDLRPITDYSSRKALPLTNPYGLNVLIQTNYAHHSRPGFYPYVGDYSTIADREAIKTYKKRVYAEEHLSGCLTAGSGSINGTTTAVYDLDALLFTKTYQGFNYGRSVVNPITQELSRTETQWVYESVYRRTGYEDFVKLETSTLSDPFTTNEYRRYLSRMSGDFTQHYDRVSSELLPTDVLGEVKAAHVNPHRGRFQKSKIKFKWGLATEEANKYAVNYLILYTPFDDPDTSEDESKNVKVVDTIKWDGQSSESEAYIIDPNKYDIDKEGTYTAIPVEVITINTFIRQNNVDNPFTKNNPFVDTTVFHGDGAFSSDANERDFDKDGSYRTQQKFNVVAFEDVDANGLQDGIYSDDADGSDETRNATGITAEYHKSSSLDSNGNLTNAAKSDQTLNDGFLKIDVGQAGIDDMEIIPTRLGGRKVEVFCKVSAADPLVLAAQLLGPLDYEFTIVIDKTDVLNPTYSLTGPHDGFPDYEVYINDTLIFGFDAVANDQTDLSLLPPMEFDIKDTKPNNTNQPLP